MCKSNYLILLFFLLAFNLTGQANIKIGYNLGFMSPTVNNSLLQDFNSINSTILELPIDNVGGMQGIALGLRYKLGASALEMTWDNYTTNKEAVGETIDGSLFLEELFYSMNQLSLGFENYIGIVGIGSAIGVNKVKIKDRIASSDFKKTIISDNQFTLRLNLSFNFQSDNSVGFSIKPYVQIPLSDIELAPLADQLGVSSSDPKNESFLIWGISLNFYNGRQ